VTKLKLGELRHEHKGQVELYLKWLSKHEQKSGEDAPIAIILRSDKDAEVMELLDMEPDGIHVATAAAGGAEGEVALSVRGGADAVGAENDGIRDE
jgi:hypothetical protein